MLKVNAFLLAGTAQHKERKYGKHNSDPLIQVQTFTEYQHGTHQHHYRAGSINRTDNRQRQMLHAKVTEYPGRQNYERLDNDKLMYLPTYNRYFKHSSVQSRSKSGNQYERKKYQAGEYRIQKQNGKHSIIAQ